MRSANRAVVVGMVTGCFMLRAIAASGQDVPVGMWNGTVSNPNNRNTPPASLDLKKVPDPHWRWRAGPREVLQGTFAAANDKFEVGTVRLDGDTLAFTFANAERDSHVQCELKRQQDGGYEGACAGEGFNRRLMLRPPDAP